MQYWLILVHSSNNKDYKHDTKVLNKINELLSDNVSVIVIWFGPTLVSHVQLLLLQKSGTRVLFTIPSNNHDQKNNLIKMVHVVKSLGVPISALCVSAHAAGWLLGAWKRPKLPFLLTSDIVDIIIVPFNIRFVVYDSCYMSSISSLFEHPKDCIIVASSAFHPYTSVMNIKPFGKLPVFSSKQDLINYAKKLCCSWHVIAKAKFKCLLVYDNSLTFEIAKLLVQHKDDLIFNRKDTRIDKTESNLHDVYSVATNVPEIQDLVLKQTSINCKKCINSVNSRIHGMSMEKYLPLKWSIQFQTTRWYKYLKENGLQNMFL
jgi:hypothetical protein